MPRAARPSTPPAERAPKDAPGLSYFAFIGAAGGVEGVANVLKMFRCQPHQATLTQRGCARRWTEAQAAAPGDPAFRICRGCSIGAAHAGHDPVRYSAWFGTMVCPRCREGGQRLIGGTRCVTCYNRERELATGVNGRGNPIDLRRHRRLQPVALRLTVNGATRHVSAVAADALEPFVAALRSTKGEIAASFGPPPPPVRQLRLL